jgi:hypothetical protein
MFSIKKPGKHACPAFLFNFDEVVKSRQIPFPVIPAEAGIQSFHAVLAPGVRRGDGLRDFLRLRQFLFLDN